MANQQSNKHEHVVAVLVRHRALLNCVPNIIVRENQRQLSRCTAVDMKRK